MAVSCCESANIKKENGRFALYFGAEMELARRATDVNIDRRGTRGSPCTSVFSLTLEIEREREISLRAHKIFHKSWKLSNAIIRRREFKLIFSELSVRSKDIGEFENVRGARVARFSKDNKTPRGPLARAGFPIARLPKWRRWRRSGNGDSLE